MSLKPREILVVDLDGTLLRSDMLFESFWSAFGRDWRSPFLAVAAAGLLLGGTLGVWALMQLSARTGEGGPLGRIAAVGHRMMRWMTAQF